MSDRSGCSLAELTVLGALDAVLSGRPRAHVSSAKALAAVDERIGLGPHHAYELLLDLARPWVIPVPLVAVQGNYGDRSFGPPADPGYTQCRPSRAGQLVLDAEAHRLAPVPVGLINGTTYRGGTRPPLDPPGVLAALRRLLDDPGVPDAELDGLACHPWSGGDCTVTGDLAALAGGRRVVLQESARVTRTSLPVPPALPAARCAPAGPGTWHVEAGPRAGPVPCHLVIESLPGRTMAAEVTQTIAGLAGAGRPGGDPDSPQRWGLPVAEVDDQSQGGEVQILVRLRPGADPAAVRDQLFRIHGMSAETTCAFPAPLADLLRSWTANRRGEDIAAAFGKLESAVEQDRRRAQREH